MRSSQSRMRSGLVVRASDFQCTSCNGPGFDPSIRRHSGIWGAADEAVLNTVWNILYCRGKATLSKSQAGTMCFLPQKGTNLQICLNWQYRMHFFKAVIYPGLFSTAWAQIPLAWQSCAKSVCFPKPNFYPEMEFLNGILLKVSKHELESSQTRVFIWFSTFIFPFYKMLFMK